MKKSLLFYSFIFSFFTSFSQHLIPIQYDTLVHKYEVITTGLADFGATGIERQFSSKLLFGGEITNDIKDASFDGYSWSDDGTAQTINMTIAMDYAVLNF